MSIDPVIAEICRRNTITDYLHAKGIDLVKAGKRFKCKCPIPSHTKDDTPSFYVWTAPDGTEMFTCFGRCGTSGNIITLMRLMENEKNGGRGVKMLADKSGMSLKNFKFETRIAEPLPNEIMEFFCEDDKLTIEIAEWAIAFMKVNNTADAVNKVSRLYERIDRMTDIGDEKGLQEVYADLRRTVSEYK